MIAKSLLPMCAARLLALMMLLGGAPVVAQVAPAPLPNPNLTLSGGGSIHAIARQPDGGMVIGGYFTSVNGVARSHIARLRPDGTLDPDWNPLANAAVIELAVDQSSGAVYVAGTFSTIGGQTRISLAKLAGNGGGAADASWDAASAGGSVKALAVDSSGAVYAGGQFTAIGGLNRRNLAKLNGGTGAADASWNPSPDSAVDELVAGSGGAVYVGGRFTQIGGQERTRLAKLAGSGTGAADTSWNPSVNSDVKQLVVGSGGAVYVGGFFTSIGGQSRNYIAKLAGSGTGAADANWNPSADQAVLALTVDSSGAVYAGGRFTSIGGQSRNRIAKLTGSGTGAADASWNPSSDGDEMRALALGSNGAVHVAGGFFTIGGLSRRSIAALPGTVVWRTLTYTANANGTISGTSPQTVPDGGSGTPVTAAGNTGYRFVNWSDGSTANPRTDTNVTANRSVSASFALNTYAVEAYSAGNGIITPNVQTVNHGATATFTLSAATGYHPSVSGCGGSLSGTTYTTGPITANCVINATFALNTYAVTATAGSNGTITPVSQAVNHGSTTTFTVTPAAGYHASVSGCGGNLSGTTYTTGAITADCAVTASFAINTHEVTATAGANGTIAPPSQTVNHGATTTFTVTPAANYQASVSGCDGSLSGSTYTSGAITAACAVSASFALNRYTLTYDAGANGTIIGTSPQTVDHGASGTAVMAVANAGYQFTQWSDGSNANPRTDDNVTADISVSATFAVDSPNLSLTIDAGRDYVRHGQVLTYAVSLSNTGEGAANPLSIAMVLPPQLDAAAATWVCANGGAGAQCAASGSGALQDSGVLLPAGRSLTWLVTVPVRSNAVGADIETTVGASVGAIHADASDRVVLVITRDGFEANGDGAQGEGVVGDLVSCPSDVETTTIDEAWVHRFALPSAIPGWIDTVLVARGQNGAGFRIERARLGDASQVQLIAIAVDGSETASAWSAVEQGASLTLTTLATDTGARVVLLDGAGAALHVPLPAHLNSALRIHSQSAPVGGCY